MKTSFLITTVTAALLVGTGLVSAQNTSANPKQEQKVAASILMKSQDKVQNNAQDKSGQAAQNKATKDKAAQDKAKDNSQPTAQKSEPVNSAKASSNKMSKRVTRRGYGAYAQSGMHDRYTVIVNNRVVGRDPDPRIRFELRRDDPARRS